MKIVKNRRRHNNKTLIIHLRVSTTYVKWEYL